ncbi:MAG: FIST N-terminal domain-containing protein [Bacteroidota bacterium]|nr:FIST N-terminal domain-containing protein [Bacteroidota bacterium]
MKAKSIKGNSPSEIKTELEQSMADGYKPTLAIVFISVKQDRDAVCKVLDDAGIAIFGATTNGEFTGEGISSGEIAMLLLDINPAYFSILFEKFPENKYKQTTQSIATKALEKFAHPSFLIAGSNLATDAEELLHGFEDILGKQVNVYGGMAGDDFAFKEQLVFTNSKSSNNGIVVLVLDEDKISIKGRATCGWNAVGTEKTVTKSVGNHVYTIDDTPVLDLVIKYGGLKNVTPENFALEHSITLPLQLQRECGDPVMRAGLVVDWNDRSYYCSGSVPQGSKVRFSIAPDFDVIEKVIKGCEDLKANEMPEADAILLFSCAGRLLSLGPLISEEIEGIRKVWNVPMAGMFSNAEMARATNGNLEMHGLTACCVALKEK